METYKTGDWVKVVSVRGSTWAINGAMDKYLGTIQRIVSTNNKYYFDNNRWTFSINDFERHANLREVIKKGDIIKLINKRADHWNLDGGMDKYLNTNVTIKNVYDKTFTIFTTADWRWKFRLSDIHSIVTPVPTTGLLHVDSACNAINSLTSKKIKSKRIRKLPKV